MKNLTILISVLVALAIAGGAIWYFGFLEPPQPEQPEQPEQPPLPEEKLSFEERVKKLDSSQKLIDYLNKYFAFKYKEKDKALSPKQFFKKKKGSGKDFAVFSAYVLNKRNYIVFIEYYKYLDKQGEEKFNAIVLFHQGKADDIPRYITFSKSGVRVLKAGKSFDQDLSQEAQRLNINIKAYKIFSPGDTDFSKGEWTSKREL